MDLLKSLYDKRHSPSRVSVRSRLVSVRLFCENKVEFSGRSFALDRIAFGDFESYRNAPFEGKDKVNFIAFSLPFGLCFSSEIALTEGHILGEIGA